MKRTLQALLLALSLCPAVQAAGTVVFTPSGDANSGSAKGDAAIAAVGAVPLKDATVYVNGKVITVKAASDLCESPHTVLAGSVLRCESTPVKGRPGATEITALSFFMMGELSEQLDDKSQPEVIFRNGGQVQGRIIGPEGTNLIVRLQNGMQVKIPVAEILYIRSPRVYVLKMSGSQSTTEQADGIITASIRNATVRPTAAPRAISMSSIVPPELRKPEDPLAGADPMKFFEESMDPGRSMGRDSVQKPAPKGVPSIYAEDSGLY